MPAARRCTTCALDSPRSLRNDESRVLINLCTNVHIVLLRKLPVDDEDVRVRPARGVFAPPTPDTRTSSIYYSVTELYSLRPVRTHGGRSVHTRIDTHNTRTTAKTSENHRLCQRPHARHGREGFNSWREGGVATCIRHVARRRGDGPRPRRRLRASYTVNARGLSLRLWVVRRFG